MEIMTRANMKDIDKDLLRIGLAHIVFSVYGKEKVDKLT